MELTKYLELVLKKLQEAEEANNSDEVVRLLRTLGAACSETANKIEAARL